MFARSIIVCIMISFLSAGSAQVDISAYQDYLELTDADQRYDALSEIIFGQEALSPQAAQRVIAHLENQYQNQGDLRWLSLAHLVRANDLYYQNDREGSLSEYLKVATLFDDAPNSARDYNLIISGHGNYASVLGELGQKVKSIQHLQTNLHLLGQIEDLREYADWYYNIATSYSDMAMPDSAAIYFQKCYEIDLQLENQSGLIHDLRFIGESFRRSKRFEEALDSYQQALSLVDGEAYTREKVIIYGAIGTIHQQLGRLDSAEIYVQQAINLIDKVHDQSRYNRTQLQLSEIYLAAQKYDLAYPIVQSLKRLRESDDHLSVVIGSYIACAKIDLARHDLRHAEGCLLEGLAIAKSSDMRSVQANLFPLLVRYYERVGDPASALIYSKAYQEMVMSLNDQSVQRALLEQRYQYDLSQVDKERRLALLEKEVSINKLQNSKRWQWIIGGIALFLGGLGYVSYQNLLARQKINAQKKDLILEKKNNELIEKQMALLRGQMNPHFLFNSLNSVNNAIINDEPRRASRYLTKFSKLMRQILNNSTEKYITLQEELATLQLYCQLEAERYDHQFEVIWDIDQDISEEEYMIPPMLIQPYIENAIKHGLRPMTSGGILRISLSKDDQYIIWSIDDNGIGRAAATHTGSQSRKSMGMSITQERIDLTQAVYGMKTEVQVIDKYDDLQATGTTVIVRLPKIHTSKVPHHDKV